MAPDFLPETEYPKKPFGMFIVIGKAPANVDPVMLADSQCQATILGDFIFVSVMLRGEASVSSVQGTGSECISTFLVSRDAKEALPIRNYSINQRML
jgi:hypothetical protein